jgi:hypothetical protein
MLYKRAFWETEMAVERTYQKMTDTKIENILGQSAARRRSSFSSHLFCAGVIYLSRHGHALANYRVFQGEPSDLHSLHGIVRDAMALNGCGIIQLGYCS